MGNDLSLLQQRVEELETENSKLRQLIQSYGLEIPTELATSNGEIQEFSETAMLEDLKLLPRTYNAIKRGTQRYCLGGWYEHLSISTIKELISHPLSDFMLLVNFGEQSAIDLILELDRHGLTLPEETDPAKRSVSRKLYRKAKYQASRILPN